MTNKIGWCGMTWNPVWGCLNHCEYCYARGIAKRFWKIRYEEEVNYHFKIHPGWAWTGDWYTGLKDFRPTFLEAQFDKKFPKKPQRIFVGSMSEIYYWEKEWVRDTLDKVLEYPQHTFQFLTKYPEVYDGWYWHENCWLGITVTQETDLYKPGWNNLQKNNKHFISFEPLLEDINLHLINWSVIDWVIIGAETGNRKGKVIPKRSWVEDILFYCSKNKIPVYIKDNLSKYYDEYRGYKQFPKGANV